MRDDTEPLVDKTDGTVGGNPSEPASRHEFGSYTREAKAIQAAIGDHVGSIAQSRLHRIIPEENVRRFIHGVGWTSPASPEHGDDTMKVVSNEYVIRFDDVVGHDLSVIAKSILSVAQGMSDQQIKGIFESVSGACERSGNVVNAAEKPFPEAFMEMMEKIELGVDADGEVSMPSIFVGPEEGERMIKTLLEQPPEYQARAEALMEQKKAAALAAEGERLSRFKRLEE